MRTWSFSALAVIVLACGGSTDTGIDGGNDASNGNDSSIGNDSSNGNDTGTPSDSGNTDATEASVDAGPFDPSQLGTNLVLWLEGAKGITGTGSNVATWADQTSYHNDASGGTGGGAHQPTVNATAINALPAVEFANATNNQQYLQITDSASLEFGTGDFAVFMVAQYTNPATGNGASQGTFYAKIAGNTTPIGPQLYGNAGTGTGNTLDAQIRSRIDLTDNINSVGTTYNDGMFHRIGIRRNGSALEVWTDAVSASFTPDAGATVDVSATGSDAFIGAQGAGGFGGGLRLLGGIAEVVGVKGTLSDGDVSNLDGYFKTKYAL